MSPAFAQLLHMHREIRSLKGPRKPIRVRRSRSILKQRLLRRSRTTTR